MFKARHILAGLLLAGPVSFGAEEQPRQARPPADYSGRVQMHDAPASLGNPLKPDPVTAGPDVSSAQPSSAPEVRARPTPIATPIDPYPADTPGQNNILPRSRDLLDRGERMTDPKSGTTGWGWLADDIATNRARRAARDAGPESERDDQTGSSDAARTNREETVRTERTDPDREDATDQQRPSVFDPVVGWDFDSRESPRVRMEPAPEPDVRAVASADAGLSAGVDRYRFDATPSSLGEAPGLTGIELPADADRRVPEPSRWPLGGDPWNAGNARAGSGAPLDGSLSSGAGAWQPAGFSPFSIAPQEPLSVAPTPLAPALSLSPAPAADTRSLGGMGSERERATPKTLPW